MNCLSKILSVAALALALGLGLSGAPVHAQQPAAPKPASAAAIAMAGELLTLKGASAMYDNLINGLVERTKGVLIQSNLNYQKDLNEIAPLVAKQLAGRDKEIGDGMAKIYAGEFTEQELKDLLTFYKAPLGKKLLAVEPRAVNASLEFERQWADNFAEVVNAAFRAEMRKRGKEI